MFWGYDPHMTEGANERILKLRPGDVVWREFKDESIALDLRSSRYLATNAAGTLLWRQLERGATKTQLVDSLLEEFEVSRNQATRDVDEFVEECARRGLLADCERQRGQS